MTRSVRELFSEVTSTYELVNHVLTCGLDILWRKKGARLAASTGGALWLDVCTGTGEMARNLSRLADRSARVVAVDFSMDMIKSASTRSGREDVILSLAKADQLPFADGAFDVVTLSFATRNINLSREALERHFREFHRVLKPGGRYVNVETSQPSRRWIRRLFHTYVKIAVRPVGSLLSGSRPAYAYLSSTIPRFYAPRELTRILVRAGFERAGYTPMFFGAAAVHTAVKGEEDPRS